MKIKLDGRGCFLQVRDIILFTSYWPQFIACIITTGLSIKVTLISKNDLYQTWVQMLSQIGPLLRLGPK